MTMETIKQPSPFATAIQRTPNNITYDNLEFSFLVAEDFKNWLEIYNWMHRLLPTRQFDNQYKENQSGNGFDPSVTRFQDASLILLNSVSKGFMEITFTNCFPISLGGIDFSSTVTDTNPVVSTVQFAYTGYTIRTM